MNRSLQLIALFAVAFFLSLPESVFAGELYRGPRRYSTGSSFARARDVRPSTFASKRLSNTRSSARATSLKDSSPYDYRIVRARAEQAKYEQKYARWENKIAQQESKARMKAKKTQEKLAERNRKRREKELEKAARLKEKKDRELAKLSSRSSQKSIFGGSSEVNAGKKNGEMFSAPVDAKDGVPRRLTLWQRIKAWMFGGSDR